MCDEEISAWILDRIPQGWFTGRPQVDCDADEILVVGPLEGEGERAADGSGTTRIQTFREATRDQRMGIAQAAERRFGRKLSWGASVGDERWLFTTLSVPVMTRLRLPERQLLDTLVGAGVARSRSDALAWCVRLVAKHEADWISELREALVRVGQLRRKGPA
jgi:hypothetical protein